MAKSHCGLGWWNLIESLMNLPLNVTASLRDNSSSTGCILPAKSPRVPAGIRDASLCWWLLCTAGLLPGELMVLGQAAE